MQHMPQYSRNEHCDNQKKDCVSSARVECINYSWFSTHKVRDTPNKIGDCRLRAGHSNGSNNPAIRTSQYLRSHPKSKFHETDFNPTLTMRAELRLILTHHATNQITLSCARPEGRPLAGLQG